MKNKKLIIISLMLLVLVLAGVTIIEPLTNNYPLIQPFAPIIVLCGFFTFLVSVALFVYSVITNVKK